MGGGGNWRRAWGQITNKYNKHNYTSKNFFMAGAALRPASNLKYTPLKKIMRTPLRLTEGAGTRQEKQMLRF